MQKILLDSLFSALESDRILNKISRKKIIYDEKIIMRPFCS